MTIAELMEHLTRYPSHLPVKILLSEVLVQDTDTNGKATSDFYPLILCESDAIEADRVLFNGNHVLIESK